MPVCRRRSGSSGLWPRWSEWACGKRPKTCPVSFPAANSSAFPLADEPTGALDSHTGREVLSFLQKLHRDGSTIVLITHDNSIARQAERIVRLADGKIIYDGPADRPEAVVQPDELPLLEEVQAV